MTTGRKLRWGEAVFGGEVAGLGLLIAFQTVTHAGSVNAVVEGLTD
jgi:acyl-CoA thioesterase